MLHEVTSSYRELARLVPGLVGRSSSSARKKQRLLEMAASGETRPHQTRHPLGQPLNSYTSRGSKAHDPQFAKRAMRLAPNWFVSKSQVAGQKKRALLKMAKRGEPRPNRKHPLGMTLCHATSRKSAFHDPAFTKQIRKLAPHWFVSKSQVAGQKKKALLEMAKRGEPRPNRKHPIGRVLSNYTSRKSATHDPALTKQIKKLAPHWFKRCSTR
jgi:hypothetical protein